MRLLLSDVMPSLVTELEQLLLAEGEPELSAQVRDLRIVDRCRCGDDFCATFYTEPPPKVSYGIGHRNIALTPKDGMIILDVVGPKIACVEVLYRDEIQKALQAVLP